MALLTFLSALTVIYGVVSFQVKNKSYQFALLSALGASKNIITSYILKEVFIIVCFSSVMGLVCSLLASQVVAHFIFKAVIYPISL